MEGNTKEKCYIFLANLIDLSKREPKPVEKTLRNLIQELVNANMEPEDFCGRLESLLNVCPQPSLGEFLRISLPLLREALFTKEVVIKGIKPPPHHVMVMSALTQQLPKIQLQKFPISQNQTTTIGGLRMPTFVPNLLNTHIRVPLPRGMQQQQLHTNFPHLQSAHSICPPTSSTTHIPAILRRRSERGNTNLASVGDFTYANDGQTQDKEISSTQTISSQPPSLASISNCSPSLPLMSPNTSSILSTINSVATKSLHASNLHHTLSGNNGMPNMPTVQLPPHLTLPSINFTFDCKSDIKIEPGTFISGKTANTASNSARKASSQQCKDKQDKNKYCPGEPIVSPAAATATSFFQEPSISMSSSMCGDDDINDVVTMGGVNLTEESQGILDCTANIGTQIGCCKDEAFLHLPSLQARIRATMLECGLEEPSQDVAELISHACQERLKNVVEKLAVIAEHRTDVIKLDPRYEVTKDVRGEIEFLEELDKARQKRREELERERLLRPAKSRSKLENPEQAKMCARTKDMQRAQMEELLQHDTNMTALQAIGSRKKLKLEDEVASTSGASGSLGSGGSASAPLRPRIKHVTLRDLLFFLEQERETSRSQILYNAYLK